MNSSFFEIERRIFVSKVIFRNEYEYVYGDRKNEIVCFSYYNIKKDKEIVCNLNYTYRQALDFARLRSNDRRYKNFEFLIY